MLGEKDFEQLVIRNLGGIIIDFHHFSVACGVAAYLFIGGLINLTAAVAHLGLEHARHLAEDILALPKTTHSKNGLLIVPDNWGGRWG